MQERAVKHVGVLALLALTWGFDVFTGDVWLRVSGYEDSASCWREQHRIQQLRPDWLVRACSED